MKVAILPSARSHRKYQGGDIHGATFQQQSTQRFFKVIIFQITQFTFRIFAYKIEQQQVEIEKRQHKSAKFQRFEQPALSKVEKRQRAR